MDIFESTDYKGAIRAFVTGLPRQGRGELGRLARAVRIHPTLVSQVLNGPKHLTLEQACLVADHMGLNDVECDFFLGLVELDRAGSERLKRRITVRLEILRASRLEIRNRLPKVPKPLTYEEQAVFYSDWYYCAVRLLSSVPGFNEADSIATRLGLSRTTVSKAINFLLDAGLCVTHRNTIKTGPKRTHVSNDSPFIRAHHRNWRLRCIHKLDSAEQEDMFFTAPLTISKIDAKRLHKRLLDTIAEAGSIVDPSEPEEFYCFNLDFFKV